MSFTRSVSKVALILSVLLLTHPLAGCSEAQAVDFTLPNLEGQNVTLSQFQGKSNVLLVFGATWCPPCRAEVPELNQLHQEFGNKGLKILNVDVGESREEVAQFAKNMSIQYEVLLDEDSSVAEKYAIFAIPRNLFIDKEGNIQMDGFLDVKKVRKLMGS